MMRSMMLLSNNAVKENTKKSTILSSKRICNQLYLMGNPSRSLSTSTNSTTSASPPFRVCADLQCPKCKAPLAHFQNASPLVLYCSNDCNSYVLSENRSFSRKDDFYGLLPTAKCSDVLVWQGILSYFTNTANGTAKVQVESPTAVPASSPSTATVPSSSPSPTAATPAAPAAPTTTTSPTATSPNSNPQMTENKPVVPNVSPKISEETPNPLPSILASIPSPRDLFNKLNEDIIGQYSAKKIFSVGVYNHLKRLEIMTQAKKHGDTPTVEVEKSNILLFGSTGSGKTLFGRSLAKLLNVPFVIVDANCFTQAGYVGEDVQSILYKLYVQSGRDIESTERGIVFIDEIDKKAARSSASSLARDVAGEGVQQALLKMLEGAVFDVPESPGKSATIPINTSNILFIAGGAFSGMEGVISERFQKKSFGFGEEQSHSNNNEEISHSSIFNHVQSNDFVRFGLIPEFIGRFSCFVPLSTLSREELVQVLTEPRHAIVKQYQRLFLSSNVELVFTNEALLEIASRAVAMRTGARGLRSIMEQVLLEPSFELSHSSSQRRRLVITQRVIRKIDPPHFETIESKKIECFQ